MKSSDHGFWARGSWPRPRPPRPSPLQPVFHGDWRFRRAKKMPRARFWRARDARVQTPSSKSWPPWPFAGLKMENKSQGAQKQPELEPELIAESVDLYRSTLLHRSFQSFQELRISFVRFKFSCGHFSTWAKCQLIRTQDDYRIWQRALVSSELRSAVAPSCLLTDLTEFEPLVTLVPLQSWQCVSPN